MTLTLSDPCCYHLNLFWCGIYFLKLILPQEEITITVEIHTVVTTAQSTKVFLLCVLIFSFPKPIQLITYNVNCMRLWKLKVWICLWYVVYFFAVRARLSVPRPQFRPGNLTLEVRKIPQEYNNIAKLNEHFGQFGNLTNIQVGHIINMHIYNLIWINYKEN